MRGYWKRKREEDSYDEVIKYLIERRFKNRRLAEELFGIAKGVDLYEELLKGRKEDGSST